MRHTQHARGQSVAEYVLLLSIVIGAAMAMQTYVKRGLQGRMKDAVDTVTSANGGGVIVGNTQQYEPYYAQGNTSTTQTGNTTDTYAAGTTNRNLNQTVTQTGTQSTLDASALSSDDAWK